MSSLLTLTTDFGTRDAYVAAMKGTILSIHPDVRFIDISHEITPQDVMEAAFVLSEAVPYFPEETLHLVVVDPGVGTTRRPVALRHGGHTFVGPDNGLFALLLDGEPPDELVVLDRSAFWRTSDISDTFHGRDVFAPVAAHLAAGRALNDIGTPIESLKPLHWALPIDDDQGVQGWVVHVDRFGNCITNIPRPLFERQRDGRPLKCFVGNAILEGVHTTYGDTEAGEPLLLFGSSNFLEIAVNTGNASNLLDIRKGTPVNVLFKDVEPKSL
ncbi:MAG TPA: SAM-dependent chlorinase/fluorinase [Rhodothermales bacterium]|nr:SAM-dependent chlorinase/fluorinase [Rhodothermales bacterium]